MKLTSHQHTAQVACVYVHLSHPSATTPSPAPNRTQLLTSLPLSLSPFCRGLCLCLCLCVCVGRGLCLCRACTTQLNQAGKFFTVSLKESFNALGPPSALFPSHGTTCPGGNQGTRRNGGEDIMFELMQAHYTSKF